MAKLLGIDHPGHAKTFGTWDAVLDRLETALDGREYLLGGFSAVDIILASPFQWMPDLTPTDTRIAAWVARCNARPSAANTLRFDQSTQIE